MKASARKIILIALIAVSLVLLAADEYPALRFRGDGHFSGGPVFGYWIELRKIPFYQTGEYVFHFRGMPHEQMALELRAEGKTSDNEAELRVKTVIEVLLVDQNGRAICQASGPPLEHGQNPSGWVLMLRGDEAAYWHWNCVWFQLNPSDHYTMTLRIRDIDPKTPRINLIPTLTGGQLDLP